MLDGMEHEHLLIWSIKLYRSVEGKVLQYS